LADYILCLIAKFFSAVLSIMPVGAALALGRAFGRFAYFANFKRSRVAYSNMRAAFSKEKEPSVIRRDTIRLYQNFGETLVEILRIPRVNRTYVDKYVLIENRHNFDKALEKGRGIIFLTGHFGNWELLSIASALKEFPLMVLAREQKMKRLNDALNGIRESRGCKVIKKGMATREIYEHLGKNGVVGILSDQDAGKKGVFVDFFGRPTSSHRGAFVLAKKTGALIVPAFMARVKGAYHKLMLENPIEVCAGDGSDESEAVQKFTDVLEGKIRQYPEQWLWLHKRWKSTPLRKIVTLSDGKKGHLNQSLAVYEKIREYRRESGYSDGYIESKVIEVRYKSRFHRVLLALLSHVAARYALIRMRSVRLCVEPDVYRQLEASYADIVISCGAQTAAINLLFTRENNAKNVIVMKPSLVSLKGFNLAVIPEHDNAPQRENIVKTIGAPNLVTPGGLESDLKSLEGRVGLKGKRSIGLFVGGDSKYYVFDPPLMKKVIAGIIDAAKEIDANILATTSRRTGQDISELVKDELGGNGRSRLVVIANEENPEWTVGGILAASDIIVVSGESSSMVSEAASSGKHVIVFKPKKKRSSSGENKHEVLLKQLESNRFVRISEIDKIKNNIVELADSNEQPKRLDDDKKILEGVKRLI